MTSLAAHLVRRERLGGDAAAHAHAARCRRGSTGCAGRRAPPAISASAVGHGLGDGVDEVGAHRVLAVDEDVDDHDVVGEHPRLDAARARRRARRAPVSRRPPCGDLGGARVRCARRRPSRRATSRIWTCAIMSRRIGLGDEAPARAHHLGGVRGGGDDARLLDDHRHDVVVPVDAHVERHAVRQPVGPEHVLDELVGGLGVEAAAVERALEVVRVAARGVAHQRATLLDGDLVEAGKTGSAGHGEERLSVKGSRADAAAVEAEGEATHAIARQRARERWQTAAASAEPHADVAAAGPGGKEGRMLASRRGPPARRRTGERWGHRQQGRGPRGPGRTFAPTRPTRSGRLPRRRPRPRATPRRSACEHGTTRGLRESVHAGAQVARAGARAAPERAERRGRGAARRGARRRLPWPRSAASPP